MLRYCNVYGPLLDHKRHRFDRPGYSRRKTVEEQQRIHEKGHRMNTPPNFEHKKVFYTIIKELDSFDVKFYRMP